jgi:hypothetical protein
MSEPIVIADHVVLVDATEKKSGMSRRVPLEVSSNEIIMAHGDRTPRMPLVRLRETHPI